MAIKGRTPGFLAAALVLLADQATKILARNLLLDGIPREFIGNAARFTLRYNYGAAFSISWGGPILLSALVALACFFLVKYMLKVEGGARVVWLGVILGGAVGNLVDRILMGKVTDFIDLGVSGWRWPTFNVADIAICIGGIAVFFLFRRNGRLEVSSEEKE